ncbi:ABC transporter permease [Ferruginibacter profundus]
MIKNYFKTAWRNLVKHKLFSFINIAGLGLAIPFALLCLIQVVAVFETDNFHPHPERTYRIITDMKAANGSFVKSATSPLSLADDIKTNYPFVEKATPVVRQYGWGLTNRIKTINVNSIYVEPAFFDIFAFPLEKGAFSNMPNTLVITHDMATIFFGTADVVGKTLSHHDYGDFIITGVLKPYKRNTHFRSDVMVSMETYKHIAKENTNKDLTAYTYLLLKPNAGEKNLDAALLAVAAKTNNTIKTGESTLHYRRQALEKISPDFEDLQNNAYVEDYQDVAVNLLMAIAIIVMAGFNYTNLTLARSLSRAKEVGIRKVTGALRYQLVIQFICEAVLIAMLSLAAGFVILKIMQQYIHMQWITWEVDNTILLWTVFILFTLLTGTIAGAIPARILSAFKPVKVLKGTISPASFGKTGFRKSLVVVQFVATCCYVFFIGSFYSQFQYMATDNKNFNRKNIYNISVNEGYRLLQNDMALNKDVERVGLVSTPFGGTSAVCHIKKDGTGQNNAASYYAANADFISNMQLQFVAGKNLPQSNSDSAGNFVVLNEQALYTLGLGTAQEAIGKSIILNNDKTAIVQGVVKNFCYYIYQFNTQPLVMQHNPAQFHVLSIKTKKQVPAADFKASLEPVWKKYYPHEAFAFSDYEKDMYDRYYPGADMQFLGMVSFVIFVIAILGLIGMVTYSTEKRVKEIGIRKVMGASVNAIIKELSGGFVKLMAIAAAICIPFGYGIAWFSNNMFAFNNGINIKLMLLLFFLVFIIALLTIIINTGKAAMVNPVKSLRTE